MISTLEISGRRTLNLLQENPIIIVDNPLNLGVAGIRLHRHELLGKLLVEVDLTGFDDAAVVDCAVLGDGPVGVDLYVDVEGSADLDVVVLVREMWVLE
jgi:hypothetical protein